MDLLSSRAHLVACGFSQEYIIAYEETFTLVAKMASICALTAITSARKWLLYQMDVKNAFLHGDLSEVIYMLLTLKKDKILIGPNKV